MASRILIAVGEPASSPEHLPFGVRTLLDAAEEIFVVAPTLPKRFEWLASATDKAREQADERLEAVLGQLDAIGTDAAGAVGGDEPFVAFEDAIREFSPDHLLIACRGQERAAHHAGGSYGREALEGGGGRKGDSPAALQADHLSADRDPHRHTRASQGGLHASLPEALGGDQRLLRRSGSRRGARLLGDRAL